MTSHMCSDRGFGLDLKIKYTSRAYISIDLNNAKWCEPEMRRPDSESKVFNHQEMHFAVFLLVFISIFYTNEHATIRKYEISLRRLRTSTFWLDAINRITNKNFSHNWEMYSMWWGLRREKTSTKQSSSKFRRNLPGICRNCGELQIIQC